MLVVKLFLVVAIASVCTGQYDADYIPCTSCIIPHNIPEGMKACYSIKVAYHTIVGRVVQSCTDEPVCTVDPFGQKSCRTAKVCETTREKNVSIPICDLRLRPKGINIISKSAHGEFGTIYQINTPQFFSGGPYPNNMLCVWNVAKDGPVNFRVVKQVMENASRECTSPHCSCPDMMEVGMGNNRIKLCGTGPPQQNYLRSTDGLQVTFCSDNRNNATGSLIMAYKQNISDFTVVPVAKSDSKKKRRQESSPEIGDCTATIGEMSRNISRMGCQYEFMMRMAQPGVPCPSDDVIKELIRNDGFLMNQFNQEMDMCNGMDELTTNMPMMNNIESCAVDYLYRTRDCEFAKYMTEVSNGELNDVARMIVENRFPIKPPPELKEELDNKKCKKNRSRM